MFVVENSKSYATIIWIVIDANGQSHCISCLNYVTRLVTSHRFQYDLYIISKSQFVIVKLKTHLMAIIIYDNTGFNVHNFRILKSIVHCPYG